MEKKYKINLGHGIETLTHSEMEHRFNNLTKSESEYLDKHVRKCKLLTTVDLTNWDTSNVTSFSSLGYEMDVTENTIIDYKKNYEELLHNVREYSKVLNHKIIEIYATTLKNDNGSIDVHTDPMQTKSFTRGQCAGLFIARDRINKIIDMETDKSNKIERSEVWKQIHSIIKQIPIDKDNDADAPDASSTATDLESLFNKLWEVNNRKLHYYEFMDEYNSLMGEGEHQILKEEVVALLTRINNYYEKL